MNIKLNDEINKLSNDDQEKLYNFLKKELTPDTIDSKIKKLKIECYHIYYNEISELINEIEVYNHTLPNQLYGFIEYIFNLLSFCTLPDINNNEMLKLVIKYEQLLIQILYIILIKNILNNIKDYKKIFRRFNSCGVHIPGNKQNIRDWSNSQYKQLKKNYKKCIKTFKKAYSMDNSLFMALCNVKEYNKKINTNVDFSDLEDYHFDLNKKIDYSEMTKLLEEVKSTNDICEQYYPNVVGNGYTKDIWEIIINILTVVSIVIALIVIII